MHITLHHIKLYKPSRNKQEQLNLLLRNWNKGLRSALKIIKHWGFTSYTKSHKHTYRVLRNNYSLPSQIAVECNRKAIEIFKVNQISRFKSNVPVRLVNGKSFAIIVKNGRYFAKILTPNGKIFCPLAFGKYQLNYLADERYIIKTADLYFSKGEWYLNLVLEYQQKQIEPKTVMGIDLGIVNLASVAVIDQDKNILHTEMFSGRELRFKRLRYRQKRKLKSKKAGSQKISTIKENRICREVNFHIANRIIELAAKNNSLIVFENLKNIRSNITKEKDRLSNYEKNSWAYYQLKEFVKHKACLHGIPVIEISPFKTSQICSTCQAEGQRITQSLFLCPNGHRHNADKNASINIAVRGLQHVG
ncbi:hypothetical protein BBF96_03285 [Anoxybacter fermentans]|uniref:Transposase n=1 Tax=Anoxybacter fermentans TaxID=1323375 RepID=A0A3Q9HP75_9FIRM|nr:RNA-guided endonuclease TnpB family protein [Anoxybacter fermentans]AZR72488.1 hypothetical protein BBF96_03285 [Anoxybacter fermentans]